MEFLDRRRVPLLSLLAFLIGLGPLAQLASAQYFGRNKVQYETFDFQVLKTEHFDIYYYPSEREAVEQAARMAERWYARLSRLLNHQLNGRQPIILYASHPHFEQTTALQGQIGEATGGVTEALKRRVVLPMAGPLAETDHVLGHELVHAFQFDISSRGAPVGGNFPSALQLPLWFIEGMAEYLSVGPIDAHTAMWMRDAARREELPSLQQLNNPRYFPYRYGHALWAYIAGRWGDQAVGEIMKSASRSGNAIHAIVTTLEISSDSLSQAWKNSIVESYKPIEAGTKGPEEYGRQVIGAGREASLHIAPALSPDGEQVVFLSERSRLAVEMYLADVETGEIERKILKTALDPHFESLQFINSAGAWHPDGELFVFSGVAKGQPVVSILDVAGEDVIEEYKIPELGEIFNPAWSPDGRRIVFTGQTGGLTDLYVLDTETGETERLTNDQYAALHPAWSPDGERIAYVTDRFTTDLRQLKMGSYQLALIDPESGEVEEVPGFSDAKNTNPQWSRDGSSLYFISDANGISNIYRLNVAEGAIHQVTNLLVGVSGITALSPAMSVASDDDRLIFSAYEGDGYSLYVIESEETLRGAEPVEALTEVSPTVLPPTDRPVGDVMALLNNPTLGLPEGSPFESQDYGAGLSLDYIAPPSVAVGSDRFGTFVGGGTALFFSDMLGRHTLTTLLQVNGDVQDIAALVGYANRRTRLNWGITASQIPIVTFGLSRTQDTTQGTVSERITRFRQINREVGAVLSYPFSRVSRIELNGQYRNISFASEITTRALDLRTGRVIGDEEQDLPDCSDVPPAERSISTCDPDALNLGQFSAALVYDNAFFGATSPILGQRYRLEVQPTVGTLNFVNALVDYRRYVMFKQPYTLAGRIVHFGRYGAGGEDERLVPLFIGYQPLVRGYSSGSFSASECQTINLGEAGNCPVFDQLLGSRIIVTNLELRFPVFEGLGMQRPAGFPPLELAPFFDAGIAWTQDNKASFLGGNRDPVTSYGVALRVNVFGAAIVEFDYVHPNDRPEKGWFLQLGITPGY